ncbi:hypothetical protein HMPREF1501_0515 [Fusobacterium sp. OBRC1]|uniref:Uncharacterized protein n=1 Tax=Fusobacterium polymorphum ATCC 10953 TaxID=393480 RepID=A5TSY7_FUSNP|nr:hypothetical protein FNP_0195 [Fusobacterium polymorphum ATCC 10953]EUB37046.1 hypothetical protein HMPREF1501_0515 [Fusobacterium sp. OBRC1]
MKIQRVLFIFKSKLETLEKLFSILFSLRNYIANLFKKHFEY